MATEFGEWREGGRTGALGSSRALEAVKWVLSRLRSRGVRTPAGNRLERVGACLLHAHERPELLQIGNNEHLRRVAEAERTLAEMLIIAKATGTREEALPEEHRGPLETMLGGRGVLEQAGESSKPRDTQFECYVRAYLAMGGKAAGFGEPDIRLLFNGEDVGIAAKRVRSPTQLVKRLREGANQIAKYGGRGFIAVNLDAYYADKPLPTDLALRGPAFNARLSALNDYYPRLLARRHVLGVLVFVNYYGWAVENGLPVLSVDAHMQRRFISREGQSTEAAIEFFDALDTLAGSRLSNL